MGLLHSPCARFAGAAILCVTFGLGAPSSARAQSSPARGGLIDALADIAALMPRFNNDPADLRHLEKALTQLLDVLEKHHHHHKPKHPANTNKGASKTAKGNQAKSPTTPNFSASPVPGTNQNAALAARQASAQARNQMAHAQKK